MADEDAAAIPVEGQGNAEATEQVVQEVEIAFGGFGEEELGGEDFAGGIILHAGEVGAATFEPVMRGGVQLHQFSFARRA